MPFSRGVKSLYNVVALGFVFMLVFTAFQTTSILQTTALKSAFNNTSSSPTMKHLERNLGYYTLCIIYGTLAFSNWIAPSIIVLLGNRPTMLVSAALYTLYIASLIYPIVWTILAASVFLGLGAGTLWTAQGAYLSENSDENTSGRNSGIFWALLQASLFIGNIFVYIFLYTSSSTGEETSISPKQNMILFSVLTVFCIFGTLSVFFLTKPPPKYNFTVSSINHEDDLGVDSPKPKKTQVLKDMGMAFVGALKLCITKQMIFLSLLFIYSGLELNFWSGVYGTSIGNVKHPTFGAKSVGLNGAFIGVGEVVGGLLFMIVGHYLKGKGRVLIVISGYVIQMATFFSIYLNLPTLSPSTDPSIPESELMKGAIGFDSNIYVAFIGSFLLGFGDSCINTQIYAFITGVYAGERSAAAMALYKFYQSIAAMVAFFYNPFLNLNFQLIILVVAGTIGVIGYIVTEVLAVKNLRAHQVVGFEETERFIESPKSGEEYQKD